MLATSNPEKNSSTLAALQLGWLAVEAFGLLRRYARHRRPAAAEKVGARQRFSFAERSPNLTEQVLTAMEMLNALAARLTPDLPPPFVDDLSRLPEEAKRDIGPLWSGFEDWSRQVWNHLQVTGPLAGQAFACGGDLADTYWYAQGAGAGNLAEMLRSYRMQYLAQRVDDLAAHLPDHAAQAIRYSLEQWSIGEIVGNLDEAGQKRLLERLESQVKVWRDLLFGLRQASSYLTPRDRRQIAWSAVAASAGLVVLVGLAVWLAVLALAGAGRSLMGSPLQLPVDASQIGSAVLAYVSNWQNWSALLATVSSVLAILTGVVKGLSGWLWAFHCNCREALALGRIEHRTYRDASFRQREEPVAQGMS